MDGLSASEVFTSHEETKTDSSFHLSADWRDWAGLPGHLLFDIADKFTDVVDYVGFGDACIGWQSVFLQNMKSVVGSPLLLVDSPNDSDYYNRRALYSLSTKSVCNFKIQLPHSKVCRGSSFGWLITMEEKMEDNYHIQLQNLFLNRTIDLPPLDNIVQLHPDEEENAAGSSGNGRYLWKAVLSSDPSISDDFIVMGIMSRYLGLAYFKHGNKCWTPIEEHWSMDPQKHKRAEDVIFFHKARQFYVLLFCGTILAIEFHGDEEEPKLVQVTPPLPTHLRRRGLGRMHLVEDLTSGDLLQVCRMDTPTKNDQNGKLHILVQFHVFKFNPVEQSWTRIHDLGGSVLFIGSTNSVLRPASNCPGCVPNCIYYTSGPSWAAYSPKKVYTPIADGIYNMKDGTVQQHYSSTMITSPATIWLEPTVKKTTTP